MAISGLQEINVGLPNESANSDSLYTAFTKTKDNFENLFANASPVPVAGNGITVTNISNVVTVSANLIAGNNIVLTDSAGAIIIEAISGGPSGSITGVIAGSGLTGGGYSGNVTLALATSGVTPASYTNPTITIDSTGRITSASNNTIAGTVTSVGLTPGTGISISGGPVTSAGTITVTNTGVTRLLAGTGISLSSANGNVTVSANTSSGTVTSVGVSSSQLVITGSPVVTSGTIGINLPANATFSGNVTAGNLLIPTGNIIYTPRHGAFYSNIDQTNPVANTARAMTFNNTFTANGVSVVSNSRLTIAKPGVYNIQFSAQLTKTGGGTSVVDIWLNKDGSPVDWTNTIIYVSSGNPKVAAWNFVENVTVANTYFEIMWNSTDTLIVLEASGANTSPTRPGIPSVIVTVTPVGA